MADDINDTEKLHNANRLMEAGASALERMKLLGLSPTPQVYEVWYRYFQGDPDITTAIENESDEITEEFCVALFNKYLSQDGQTRAVGQVSEQMQASIAELASMLSSVRVATTEYGETLDDAQIKIEKITTSEELDEVVSSLVKGTKKVVEQNQQLEVQLVNSSKQVTELRQSLDTIRREVLTDGLTGLYNRKAFDTQMTECIKECDLNNTPLVLMLLDIDFFKKFNDSFGHQIGDQVLRLVARTLTDNVKGRDIPARYGGEEFAIILPDTPLKPGLIVAEALRKGVESKEIINKATKKTLGRITLSIGVAEYQPGESVQKLVKRADAALYRAKKEGRNCVREAE